MNMLALNEPAKIVKGVKYPWIHLSYETHCLDKTDKICNMKTIAGVIRIMQIFLSEVWTLMYRSTKLLCVITCYHGNTLTNKHANTPTPRHNT